MKHYEYEINLFLDGELEKDNQKELFAHLTVCEDCRALLYEVMDIKNKSKKYYEEIIPDLNQVILPTAVSERKKEKNIYKPFFYFASAAVLLLGFLFLINQTNGSELQSKLRNLESSYTSLQQNYNNVVEQKSKNTAEIKSTPEIRKLIKVPTYQQKRNEKPPLKEFAETESESITNVHEPNNKLVNTSVTEPDDNYIQAIFANNKDNDNNNRLKDKAIDELKKEYRNFRYENKYGTRDLLQRLTPYLHNGKIKIDTAKVRDLFMRYGKDKNIFKPVDENNLGYIKTRNEKAVSLYAQYINSLKTEKVTNSDFLIPQLIGN